MGFKGNCSVVAVVTVFYTLLSLHALSQVYILGYIARAVLYKVPDGSSSENGSVEGQGTLRYRFDKSLFHDFLMQPNNTFCFGPSKSTKYGKDPDRKQSCYSENILLVR